MKTQLFYLGIYLFSGTVLFAAPVSQIAATDSREEPIQSLSTAYEEIRDKIDSLPLTHKLEELNSARKKGIDISFTSDHHRYVIPMLLAVSGNKHAAGFSIESKNIFHKQEDISL